MGRAGDGDDGDWEVPHLAGLGVPVIQAPSSNRSRDEWDADDAGLTPLDVARAWPSPSSTAASWAPLAFKEEVDDGGDLGTPLVASRTDPGRTARLALAARHARLRRTPPEDKRVAVVLSAYPTKRSRLGNAVGLDTPASVIDLLHALRAAGYRVDDFPADGDGLMALLADRLTYDQPTLTPAQAAAGSGDPGRGVRPVVRRPARAGAGPGHQDGPPPGEIYVHGGDLVFPGLDLGGVLVTIQPPRASATTPSAPTTPPTPPPHHYLAFYRWLDARCGADAVVHVGKHGTLEWLPGKANALSAACFPTRPWETCRWSTRSWSTTRARAPRPAALPRGGGRPPHPAHDPGRGHRRPGPHRDPARRARQRPGHGPEQAPALRRQVWEVLVDAEIHRDLGLAEGVADREFDEMVLHVDGYQAP